MLSLYLSLHEFPPGASVSPQYSKNMHVGLIKRLQIVCRCDWLVVYLFFNSGSSSPQVVKLVGLFSPPITVTLMFHLQQRIFE